MKILVIVEYSEKGLADISLQMLSKGRHLAEQTKGELQAVIIGKDTDKYTAKLGEWADRVLVAKDSNIKQSLAEPYQKIVSALIKDRKPKIVLIGNSAFGMDLAPALSIEAGVPIATDCIDIRIHDDAILVTKSIYNGKINAEYSFAPSDTVIITGRPGEFPVEEAAVASQIEKISFPPGEIDYKSFEGYSEPEASEVDITQAEVLVSVGRGIKDKANVKMVEELAGALGGVISCSRPVVDNGWLPSERQVGLSGKTVKPKVYVALGISGAFQHIVGIKGAKMIVAINKDAGAPIFATADYGIVDDLFKVAPVLTKKIQEMKH